MHPRFYSGQCNRDGSVIFSPGKVVKPCHVNKISKLLTDNMGLFFLPAGVGLMTSIGVISHYWAVILISCVISTILVIASVALVQQNFEKRKK